MTRNSTSEYKTILDEGEILMKKRPETLTGETHKAKTDWGTFYVTFNELEGEIVEIIPRLGKVGSFARGLLEHIGLLYSILLQSNLENKDLIKIFRKHCQGVADENPFFYKGQQYKSIIDFMGKKILEKLKEEKK